VSESNAAPIEDASTPSVIERFLGLGASLENPLTLLGLAPEAANEAGIIAALQRQLTRVGSNPDALTPEADEVRLALHAAAARLLDPMSRRQILAGASPAADTRSGAAPAAAGRVDAPAPGEMPVEAAMLMTMGAMGGWNRRSMRRVALVARSYGLGAQQTADTIRALMSHPAAPPGSVAAPVPRIRASAVLGRPAALASTAPGSDSTPSPQAASPDPFAPAPEEIDPGQRSVKAMLLFGGAGIVGITAIVILAAALLSGDKPASAPPPSSQPLAATPPPSEHQLFPARPKESAPNVQPIGAASPRIGDWNDQLRAMSACVAGLDIDAAAAADKFESVYNEMARKWGEASPDGVVAGVDRIVEFLYHASTHSEVAARAIGVITDGAGALRAGADLTPSQVLAAPWSAGVLARLSRERDLPASVRQRVQEALSDCFPGSSGPGDTTFRSGAVAALSLVPSRLAKPVGKPDAKEAEACWKAWIAALAAIDGRQSPLFTRTVLVALDYLLTQAAEPTQDRTIFDAIGRLTTALPWRKDDESRRWLLRWFDSPAVTAGDLYALTAALATQSGAEGVDSSMVLSTGAGESQRAELRDRYAAVWGLTAGQTRDALVQEWAKAVREAITPPPPDPEKTAVDALERAVTLARLNQAATLIWSGDTPAVPGLLEPYKRPTPAPNPNAPVNYQFQLKVTLLAYGGGGRDPSWLVKYCAAGHNIPARRALLAQMNRAPDPAEADILIEEACRGSPAQLRAEARAIVLNYKDNAAIINSMLEFAPMVPITQDDNELIEQVANTNLPSLKDPAWRVAVRRALVERLCEVLAGQGELARVEDLADALGHAYEQPTPKPADSESGPPPLPVTSRKAPAVPLESAAMTLRARWQREAELLVASGREPLSLAQIEARRSARVRLAVGRIQELAGEQVNVCELMSYVVTAEQPARSGDAAAALDELTQARRRSKHVFEQIEAGERARLRLWLIRFGEGSA
jgi:hypothetical protein